MMTECRVLNRVALWAVPLLVAVVPLAFVLPARGQREGELRPPSGDVTDAKEIVALIEQGQLGLADATKLAEKHCKGVALRVSCRIDQSEAMPGHRESPGGGADDKDKDKDKDMDKAQAAGKRLIYDVTCFAEEKVSTVQVDGLTKKVIDNAGKMPPPKPVEKMPPPKP